LTRHSSFAYTAAAVLVLVGFSAAFAGLSAATDTAAAGTEKGTDPAFGGEELPAAEEFGGDSPGSSPDFLVLFEITATTDSLTLTAIVALDPEAVLDVSGITATAEHYADYLTDHLGSTRKVLDMPDPLNPPAVTFSAEYTPFGEPYAVEGTEGFRFTGEQHDAATGFTHLRARQYDPVTGRFASEDPLAGSAALPQTQNPYAYAVNDPVGFSDPSGTCIWDLCIGEALLVLAIIGIVAAVATHHASPQARLAGDMIMMEVGTVPIFGDVLSTACYLTQDALDCAEGHCDPLAIGLDAIGIVPGVPNAGGGAHVLGAFPSPGSLGHAAGHGVGAGAMGVGVFPLYTRVTGGAAQAGFRAFDAGNFRHNLKVLTGLNPGEGLQAHHVFPQKFGAALSKAGINIHDPHFGSWVKAGDHAGWSARYNMEWANFLRPGGRSADDILDYGRGMARRYGFGLNY